MDLLGRGLDGLPGGDRRVAVEPLHAMIGAHPRSMRRPCRDVKTRPPDFRRHFSFRSAVRAVTADAFRHQYEKYRNRLSISASESGIETAR
jgi:hypothetical protein